MMNTNNANPHQHENMVDQKLPMRHLEATVKCSQIPQSSLLTSGSTAIPVQLIQNTLFAFQPIPADFGSLIRPQKLSTGHCYTPKEISLHIHLTSRYFPCNSHHFFFATSILVASQANIYRCITITHQNCLPRIGSVLPFPSLHGRLADDPCVPSSNPGTKSRDGRRILRQAKLSTRRPSTLALHTLDTDTQIRRANPARRRRGGARSEWPRQPKG